MKKISTSTAAVSGNNAGDCRIASPRQSTLAFLKQFARTYVPGPCNAMPGIVLN